MPQTERMFLRMDPGDRELIGILRERWGMGDEAKTIRAAIRRAAEQERVGGDGAARGTRGASPAVRERVELAPGARAGTVDEARGTRLAVPNRLGVDLLEAARVGKLDAVAGRAREMERLLSLLVRLTRNSVVLVGEPGTGKTALVEGLAVRMAKGEVPEVLRDRGLMMVDGAELALVARYGEAPAALARVEEVVKRGRDGAILVLNGMGALVDSWEDGPAALGGSAALARLRLALVRGEAQVIGEMTGDRYRRWAETDGLSGRFEALAVTPAGREETLAVLHTLKGDLERHHDVAIGEDALTAVAALSK